MGLTFLLVVSTYITFPPGLFFSFILLNGAAQAAAGSYLQTAVIAVASLFGPTAVQSMMAGQAAVAVAVSGVQVMSAAASTMGKAKSFVSDGSAEERSAFIFFTLSTIFLAASAGAHAWLIKMPSYKALASPLEQHTAKIPYIGSDPNTSQPLVSRGRSEASRDKQQVIRVAKANSMYEIAVALVFVVTLVRNSRKTRAISDRPPFSGSLSPYHRLSHADKH
jgi:equilibrative nucleoside transporter 1/2/3